MTAYAKPAQFDRAAQHTRGLIAKINIGRQQLGMVEDDYRQLLLDTTGQLSLKTCTSAQMEAMLKALVSKGFRPIPRKAANSAGAHRTGKAPAMHPMARKARALWISLYHLGAVRNSAEEALEAFAKRQLDCERLVWARQSDAYKLVEALKNMAERDGWHQTDRNGRPLSVVQLQVSLCEAILAKLKAKGIAAEHWTVETAIERLCGDVPAGSEGVFAIEMFTQRATALGAALRKAGESA